MAHIEQHSPGSFCWLELGTNDQQAAKAFYSGIFGWQSTDMPMGPGETYTLFKIDGQDVAGGYTLNAEQVKMHVPPHWLIYIAVESVDDTVAKASELGGAVMAPPMDVMDLGRLAVMQDPTGAHFAVWQSMAHKGSRVTGVPGTFCWGELVTRDRDKAKAFYKDLFGWEFMVGENDPLDYLHIKNGQEMIGGVPAPQFRDPNAPPHWQSYFLTANCDATTSKATELGAKVLHGPMTIDDVGRMSFLLDPQGAVFALFEEIKK